MPDATFGCPDLTTFCRLDELGLVVVGQRLERDRAVLACRVLEADDGTEGWCRRCGCAGRLRDTVTRELAHEPVGWRPTTLLVTIRRYRCTGCVEFGIWDSVGVRSPGLMSRATIAGGARGFAVR